MVLTEQQDFGWLLWKKYTVIYQVQNLKSQVI
jgi:hypothetical protein